MSDLHTFLSDKGLGEDYLSKIRDDEVIFRSILTLNTGLKNQTFPQVIFIVPTDYFIFMIPSEHFGTIWIHFDPPNELGSTWTKTDFTGGEIYEKNMDQSLDLKSCDCHMTMTSLPSSPNKIKNG